MKQFARILIIILAAGCASAPAVRKPALHQGFSETRFSVTITGAPSKVAGIMAQRESAQIRAYESAPETFRTELLGELNRRTGIAPADPAAASAFAAAWFRRAAVTTQWYDSSNNCILVLSVSGADLEKRITAEYRALNAQGEPK